MVTNLDTGQPAGGIDVSVNGSIVRTDSQGRYSITGLNGGNYTVQLSLVSGSPAQGPQVVQLPDGGLAIVDLQFFTQVAPTPVPQPTATPAVAVPEAPAAEAPPELPDSGGAMPDNSYLLADRYALFNPSQKVTLPIQASRVTPIIANPVFPVPLCASLYTVQQRDILGGALTGQSSRIIEATNLLRVENKSISNTISPETIRPGFQLCVPVK
ncbi:MAG: hypothetical protein Kow0031_07690 [Anaerolineae bacterium]